MQAKRLQDLGRPHALPVELTGLSVASLKLQHVPIPLLNSKAAPPCRANFAIANRTAQRTDVGPQKQKSAHVISHTGDDVGTRSRFHSTSGLDGPALKSAVRGGPRRLIFRSAQRETQPRRQLGGGFVLLPDMARLSAFGVPLWISALRERAGQGEWSSSSLFSFNF